MPRRAATAPPPSQTAYQTVSQPSCHFRVRVYCRTSEKLHNDFCSRTAICDNALFILLFVPRFVSSCASFEMDLKTHDIQDYRYRGAVQTEHQ